MTTSDRAIELQTQIANLNRQGNTSSLTIRRLRELEAMQAPLKAELRKLQAILRQQ